jgi:hypothetical protein
MGRTRRRGAGMFPASDMPLCVRVCLHLFVSVCMCVCLSSVHMLSVMVCDKTAVMLTRGGCDVGGVTTLRFVVRPTRSNRWYRSTARGTFKVHVTRPLARRASTATRAVPRGSALWVGGARLEAHRKSLLSTRVVAVERWLKVLVVSARASSNADKAGRGRGCRRGCGWRRRWRWAVGACAIDGA